MQRIYCAGGLVGVDGSTLYVVSLAVCSLVLAVITRTCVGTFHFVRSMLDVHSLLISIHPNWH